MRAEKEGKYNSIKAFFAAFLIFVLTVIPSLLFTKGVWIYYGDFNVQQIPFYYHAHEAIKSGNFFYDFSTDLGGSLIGCYSFYLLASPFFWLTIPFPTETVPYLMPWLTALKYACMASFSFLYIKKHIKSETFAFVGSMLYAFSGFSGAVLVYNHFHDVLAFFPLYLLLFERLIEKKKVVGFALMTAFMAALNYYFFVGEAVFLCIYYVTMYAFDGERNARDIIKDLLRAFFSGLSGVLISLIYLLPAVYYTLGNGRLSKTLEGYDLVSYKESTMILNIIKNTTMLSDISGLNSMLNQSGSRVSGIGAYIPLFSIAGVIAFFLYNKGKNKYKRLLITCAVFAAIPVLNSLFSALNEEYYARWFFMPVLIMALMTASVLEKREETIGDLKTGFKWVLIITAAIILMAFLPAKTEEDTWTVLGLLKNYEQLICQVAFSIICLVFLFLYIKKWATKPDHVTVVVALLACLFTSLTMLVEGTLLVDDERKQDFIEQIIKSESPLPIEENFYRIETDEDFYNYPLYWKDAHSITSFISTIPDSTINFYENVGVHRKVTSNLKPAKIGVRALLSGKYFLQNSLNSIETIGHLEDMEELKGYKKTKDANGFEFYENENYVRPGFTFSEFITETQYKESELSQTAKDRLLMRVLIVPDDQASEFEKYMTHTESDSLNSPSYTQFTHYCNDRRKESCSDFETSTKGFTAKSNLSTENFVFFSVPYEKGFTAYINGEETTIYKVDYGFMAVLAPKGEANIEFKYEPSLYKEGRLCSLAGLLMLLVVSVIVHIGKAKGEKV